MSLDLYTYMYIPLLDVCISSSVLVSPVKVAVSRSSLTLYIVSRNSGSSRRLSDSSIVSPFSCSCKIWAVCDCVHS